MARRKARKTKITSLIKAFQNRRVFFLAPIISIILLLALAYNFKSLFLVATVNNQPITRFALDRSLEKQSGRQTLENMILETLILQEAKKKGIVIGPEEMNQKTSEIEKQFTASGQTLDAFLASRGQSRQEFENQVKIQVMVEKMLENQANVSEQELKDYFERNKSFFPQGTTFESKKEDIQQMLVQQKLAASFQTWAENLKKEAKINYFVNF